MALTYQLIVLLGLSSVLWMGADAGFGHSGCAADCCMTCPDGWSKYGPRCFQLINDPKTWSDAEDACTLKGGNLATAYDDEVEWYRSLVKQVTGGPTRIWFGGFQIDNSDWKWSQGVPFKFRSWGKCEPNDQKGPEGCMEMMHINQHGEKQAFNDAPCSVKKAFLCARDPMPTN